MSTALMAAIFLFGDLKYAMNDDTAILRQYMGFGTGVIPEAHAFLHPLLSTPLRWLGLAAPEVPWFSWMQLALLWLACMVSVKALMQCFAHRGRSPWLGAAAGAVYLTLFGMTYACHVTFTVTAAVLGAALWVQIVLFFVVSIAALAATRPLVQKMLHRDETPTNADRVLGQTARVTETIDNTVPTGAVYADGKTWTARSASGRVIPKDTLVKVQRMEGVRLFVEEEAGQPVHS